jgi:hypothetical protein
MREIVIKFLPGFHLDFCFYPLFSSIKIFKKYRNALVKRSSYWLLNEALKFSILVGMGF